jgi:hypothetical protein
MSERKHADLWEELVDEAGEDEIDRAASVSVAQAEAELKAAGFDVAAERAKASALLDALQSGAPEEVTKVKEAGNALEAPQATPPRSRSAEEKRRTRARPPVAWLAAAAMLGVAAGAALDAGLRPPELVGRPAPPSAAALSAAADLRRQAAAACDTKQWTVCLADLDEARAVDPAGDDTPTVKTLRDKALAEILGKPAAPPH